MVRLFHTFHKARLMPNPEPALAGLQGAYSEEFDSRGAACPGGASEVSAVSVATPTRSDTLSGSIPSLFIRVMKVVRLRPRREAAPLGPPTRPSASLRAWMISLRSTSARILRTGRRLV